LGAQTGVLGRLQTVVAAAKIPGPECAKINAAMAGPARPAGSFNLTQETLSWWRQRRGGKGRGVGQRGRRETMRRRLTPLWSITLYDGYRATLGACAGNSLMERRAAGGDE